MAKKILVCDDDAALRQALVLLLAPAYEVCQAQNGEEALRVAREQKPSLVLLDVSMPGMTGLETLKRLREERPAAPVVMLSGQRQIGIVRRALAAGAASYVTKPFDEEAVKKEISIALHEIEKEDPSGRPWRVVLGGTQ